MRVADGVLVHRGELLQNQTVVVQGRSGVLLVDPGITTTELARLAGDSRNGGVRAGAAGRGSGTSDSETTSAR